MSNRARRLGLGAVTLVCLAVIAAFIISYATYGRSGAALTGSAGQSASGAEGGPAPEGNATLKVLTLNVAHGRNEGPHQALQKRQRIEANLDAIAEMLLREQPDVVALQEADGPSVWSGDFDHVGYVAGKAGLAHHCRGQHVEGLGLSYGTALLSRVPLGDSRSVTFAPSPPTFSKGFVIATFQWPGRPGLEVDVVSVHLDFSRKSVRQRQIEELIGELSQRDNPLVIMGDFNCQWTGEDGPLAPLVEKLDVAAYRPTAEEMTTFPKLKQRLDWVFISPGLEFVEYETVADPVSDHRAVVAVLRIVEDK
jgi:endonuclease/exonuclease/phosphatase family metal-dependent hydrolase